MIACCEDVCKDDKESKISLIAKSYYSHYICPNLIMSFLADFKFHFLPQKAKLLLPPQCVQFDPGNKFTLVQLQKALEVGGLKC